jgi:Amt family ammonium transporter
VIGNLDMAFLHGITLATPSPTPGIPLYVHVAYQMMFAIITPALITGAFANRVSFRAYMAFLTLWPILVYFPFVHMVWGGGFLQQWGVAFICSMKVASSGPGPVADLELSGSAHMP